MHHHHIHSLARLARHAGQFYQYARGAIDVGLLRLQHAPRRLREFWPEPNPKPLLLHYHIFKNAGTSFEWTLQEIFGESFQRYDGEVPGGVLYGEDIARFAGSAFEAQVISSHQASPPPPRVPGRKLIASILIRDPIARIRSIYAFERRQDARTPGATKAKELDFKDYVAWRLQATPTMLCNYQVHFCSRTRKTLGRSPVGEIELQKAIENLDQIEIVGTVERYDEWLALAQSILLKSFPGIALSSSRRNVTASGQVSTKATILDDLINDLGRPMAQRLLECNQLDMCLHQVADSLLTRRLGERGIKVMLQEAYASVQQDLSQRQRVNSADNN